MVEIDDKDNEPRIPFYEINNKTQEVEELSLYSFEEILAVKMARADISNRKYELNKEAKEARYPVLSVVPKITHWF